MPTYQYRCPHCGHTFTAQQSIGQAAPICPDCEYEPVEKVINSAPTIAGGIMTHAGDGRRASKEELQAKWAEETPKLAKKLRDKLGDEAVKQMPTLNMPIDES